MHAIKTIVAFMAAAAHVVSGSAPPMPLKLTVENRCDFSISSWLLSNVSQKWSVGKTESKTWNFELGEKDRDLVELEMLGNSESHLKEDDDPRSNSTLKPFRAGVYFNVMPLEESHPTYTKAVERPLYYGLANLSGRRLLKSGHINLEDSESKCPEIYTQTGLEKDAQVDETCNTTAPHFTLVLCE
ncbi:hypothetical protein VFPBJ_10136 [Purpureocillium lilacinum]|uniref:Uncharacterized protein n=1 Tax=Purpureocillium lilacinum TaxID=33203 RepID=A0A179GBS4_PURLI|nr:hypothetical protein VFPBJ_10136 [Purpureocillium lilacinum]